MSTEPRPHGEAAQQMSAMDPTDRLIIENELAAPIGRAVAEWRSRNGVEEPVSVTATVTFPTCYVDERGVSHSGPLVVCNVHIMGEDDYDEDD